MNKEAKTLSELFIEMGGIIKKYENFNRVQTVKEEKEELYGINEITKIYPKLTKHILTKAVNDGEIPVTRIGNERCFYLRDIDNFIAKNTTKNNLAGWR